MLKYDLNTILVEWCDENLTHNRAYGSDFNIELDEDMKKLIESMDGKLMYKDGTACSASHAISNIYQLKDETYIVYTDVSQARFTGDDIGNKNIIHEKCENISKVIDHLMEFSFHDPNSVGDLLFKLIHNYQLKLDDNMTINYNRRIVPILSKCNPKDIELIKAIKSSMYIWKEYRWNKIE